MDQQCLAIAAVENIGQQSFTRLAVTHQNLVGGLAHERDQLIPMGHIDRFRGGMRFRVAAAVPIEVVTTRAPGTPVVLGDDHDVSLGPVGKFLGLVRPAHGHLPAHLGLGLDEGHAFGFGKVMQGAAVAAGEIG